MVTEGRVKHSYLIWITILSLVLFAITTEAQSPVEFVLEWGSAGTGPGQFGGAHGIAVDADGNVYVADTGNDRIQKFTSEGVFLFEWGSAGDGPGECEGSSAFSC